MDHSEVDRLLDRMRGNSGELDAKSKEVLARWRSVDVILKGTVTDNAVDEKVKVEPTVNEKGHKLVVFTRRAKAFVKLEVHVLDSKDQTVDRVELIGQAQASTQQVNGKPKSIDHANLLANAQAQVIQDYLHRVMPRREYVQVQLYKDKGLPDLQIGNGLAQSGDWQAAHDSYQRALDMATGELAEVRFKPLFNLGVALEFSDRFEDARKTLQEAFRLNQDRLVSAELSRLAQREQESKRLKEQVQNAAPSR
jgi:tetratricopeptide (TPR) repeat protein